MDESPKTKTTPLQLTNILQAGIKNRLKLQQQTAQGGKLLINLMPTIKQNLNKNEE